LVVLSISESWGNRLARIKSTHKIAFPQERKIKLRGLSILLQERCLPRYGPGTFQPPLGKAAAAKI
jgi:hypothetical protein